MFFQINDYFKLLQSYVFDTKVLVVIDKIRLYIMEMKKKQVVILGVFSPIGQALISCLADQGFDSEQVQLLDTEPNADMVLPYGNETLVVQDLTTFDFKYSTVIFLCTPSILSTHLDAVLEQGHYLIDCTGILGTEPCIIPSLNLKALKKQETNIITNPTSLSITLAQVLSPIHQAFSVQYAQDTAMISVSEFGIEATNALISQTRSLYTREAPPKGPFQKIQAFNLIPEPYPILSRQTMAQLKTLLHFPVTVATCLAPIFQGECHSLIFTTRKKCQTKDLKKVFKKHPYCRLTEEINPYLTLTTQDTALSPYFFLTHLSVVPYRENTFHLWIVCDSIRTGTAFNAVQIAKHILS